MLLKARDENAEIIEEVLARLRNREQVEKVPAETFIRQYYSQVDPEDLVERTISNLCGAALAHLGFMKEFKSGAPKLRAYNPKNLKDGWDSPHTVIEIVNDDMPFLVDSVTMEVNRHGLTLHLIMHPIIAVKRSADGTLVDLAADDDKDARHESFIRVEVDRIIEPARLEALAADLARVLDDVRMAVADWKAMRDRLLADYFQQFGGLGNLPPSG